MDVYINLRNGMRHYVRDGKALCGATVRGARQVTRVPYVTCATCKNIAYREARKG